MTPGCTKVSILSEGMIEAHRILTSLVEARACQDLQSVLGNRFLEACLVAA